MAHLMATKYRDPVLRVTHSIFRKPKVYLVQDRIWITPPIDKLSVILRAWSHMPKLGFTSKRARQLADAQLFKTLGYWTIDPENQGYAHIAWASPEFIAQEHARRGELAALAEELRN